MKKIKILGSGCTKCNKLADNAKKAAEELGLAYEIEKVTDLNEITQFGILTTPGLVVDDKVVSTGKLLPPDDIKKLIA